MFACAKAHACDYIGAQTIRIKNLMLSRNLTVSTNVRTPPLVVALYCPEGNPLNTQVTNTTNKARINKSVKYISI